MKLTLEAILLLVFGLAFGRLTQLPGLDAYLSAGSQEYYWGLTTVRWLIDVTTIISFIVLVVISDRARASRWIPWIITATVCFWIVVVMGRHMWVHQHTRPGNLMHDGTLQTEVAARLVLSGQNPYDANYQGTLFDYAYSSNAPIENSAYSNLVYPPGQLLLAMPFIWLADSTQTFTELPALYVGLVLLASGLLVSQVTNPTRRIRVLLLTAGNPFVMLYPIAGYNDLAAVSLLVITAIMTWRRKWVWAGVVFGLALAVKQVAWIAAPLWLGWLWLERRRDPNVGRGTRRALVAAGIVASLMYLPFLIWNAPALIQDLIIFPSGSLPGAYPIAGSTLWHLKVFFQGPTHAWDLIPTGLISALVGFGSLFLAWRWLRKSPGPQAWLMGTAICILAISLTHRFFHDNYLMAILFLMISAYVFQHAEQRS